MSFKLLLGSILCILIFSNVAGAQNEVRLSSELDRMLTVFATKNKNQETIKAWRIQLAALSDRREMEVEKSRFENVYPYLELEWIYDNPYYILKLKNAAFKEKLHALNLLHRIKLRYSSALLVLDDVTPEKLLYNTSN